MKVAFIDFQNLSKSISTDLYKYYITLPGRPYPAKRICDPKQMGELIADGSQSHGDFTQVHSKWRMDYKKFRDYLRNKFSIDRAIIFIGHVPANQNFYDSLILFGYEIVFKKTLIQGSVMKGNIDAELVMHASLLMDSYNEAILVTGDGDFLCLAEELIRRGKLLKILTPNDQTFSQLYRPHLTYIMPITKIRGQLEYFGP